MVTPEKMKHLRYLEIRDVNITSLPEAITTLYLLQTLRLVDCWKLVKLPEVMKYMSSLRHLNIQGYRCTLRSMPSGLGQLNYLQREMSFAIQKQSEPALILKLNFKKAFDSVDWNFLLTVLRQRGFPDRFLHWLFALLSTASSSILLNGRCGPSFNHKRGLRQGDPISPFLFNLAVDVLNKMFEAASITVPHNICSKIQPPFFVLQYADDTMLFSTAKGQAVHVLNSVIHSFSLVSGIALNLNKSSLVTFNLSDAHVQAVQATLQVHSSPAPLVYLGLPLTLRRPDRLVFQGLIDKVQDKLAGWKSSLLSRAGRLVLARSVLSTVPVYFMSVFKLPAWVIKALDRIRCNFIWGSSNSTGRAMHLLSLDKVCLPKELGGFGIQDLRLQNISLLLRWWWRLYHHENSLWSILATILFAKLDDSIPPLAWNEAGSFFWRDLMSIRLFFQISTVSVIESGLSSLFWFSNWGASFLFFFNSSDRPSIRRNISLHTAYHERFKFLTAPLTLRQHTSLQEAQRLSFNSQKDQLLWKWTTHGNYTAASAYKYLISAGKTTTPFFFIWKIKVPPSLKLFLLLLANGRLLTQDQLLKRNIFCTPGCVLCTSNECETANHLFFNCDYSGTLWRSLGFQLSGVRSDASLKENFLTVFEPAFGQRRRLVLISTNLWAIWLERNNRTFRQLGRPLGPVQQWIISESTIFMKCY
ncbi:RNA-directed DNA polymerase (reverse transcriptase)-related family protein [Rhynchospora pubera]|uniref:RNA-directed DNA polymerase (Reverse transcriptase)-related family protein n=1 Tax=Rhynchospora pubera TaxID=906938 RepID=A0AAV8DP59_9POAL|nr:RNA-directed DNA polymerase (reverse transcriptase)-related family protein [Rhynchospora pubera]